MAGADPRQRARVNPVDIRGHELGIAVGRHIDPRVIRVIEGVGERYTDKGCAIVGMIADVRRAWHDAAPYLRYDVMVCRRATQYCVVP